MAVRNYNVMGKRAISEKKYSFTLSPSIYSKRGNGTICPDLSFGFREEHGAFASAEGLMTVTPFPLEKAERCYTANGFYVYKNGTLMKLEGTGFVEVALFSHAPNCCKVTLKSGEEGYLFYDGSDWLYRGTSTRRLVGKNAKYACFHYERLFIWDGEKLHFSAPCDPFDWNEALQDAGCVELPSEYGKVVAMKAFSEQIYLVRERGLTLLRAFADNRNYKAIHVGLPCSNVVGESVVEWNGELYFFSEGNLYKFNGDCSLLCETGLNVEEAVFDGKHYLARGTLCGESVLSVYRKDGTHSILKMNVDCLSEFAFFSDGRCVALSEREELPMERVWFAKDLAFSHSAFKRVTELFMEGTGEVSLSFSSDVGKREVTATLPTVWKVGLCGKRFAIRLIGHGKIRVDNMEVRLRDD